MKVCVRTVLFVIGFYLYSKLYFNVYDRQTQLLANENDICCVFFKVS